MTYYPEGTDRDDMLPGDALQECYDLWVSGAWPDVNAEANLEEVMMHVKRLLDASTLPETHGQEPDAFEQAGLGIMREVFSVLYDRETVPETVLDAVTPEDVTEFYEGFIGPAIDKIENTLLEDNEPDGAPCCPDPDCPGTARGGCTFPGYADNH